MTKKSGLTALALVLIAGLGLWSVGGKGPLQGFSPVTAAMAEDAAAPATTEAAAIVVPDMVLGNPDAKVTLVEYASYTCPHCRDFHTNVFKDFKKNYIDTGKVKFVYREVYFDKYGLWAAMVARCGGDLRYFGINNILFDTQQEWAGSDDPAVVVANLKKIGRTAGMDDPTITACLENGDMATAMVAKYQADFTADKVEGTPTLFINGEKHGNMNYNDLAALIDAELAK